MISRSILAISMLITILFSNTHALFPDYHISRLKNSAFGIEKINIFLYFDNVQIPFYICTTVLIIVIFGILPAITSILHFVITFSMYNTMLVSEGGDQINMILTLLIIPFCLNNIKLNGYKLSFISNNLFLKLNLLFIKIQMSIIYLQACIEKIYQKEWNNGTAMYYWFNDSLFGANIFFKTIFGFLFENNFSLFIITWSVIFLEFFLSLSIFMKQKNRYIFFCISFLFHFLIFLIHGLGTFFISMTAGLILVYFNNTISFKENIENIKTLINFKTLKNDLYRENKF